MVSRSSEEAMKVHIHTKFCLLYVVTFLFHQCCHGDGHHQHGQDHDHDHNRDHERNRAHDHNDLQISQAPYMPPRQGEAETEQRFYILQLFRRYGQRDRLDFGGFQSLLLSLGLGEVKVVVLDHEKLGHDHVVHLDLLEVQNGLHSHTPPRLHPQPHTHPHPHSEQEESWTNVAPCKLKDAEASANPTAALAIEGSRLEDHDHGDGSRKEKQPHHHDHRHKHPHMRHHHKHNSTDTESQQAQLQDAMGQEQLKQQEQSGQPDQKDQLPMHPAQTEQLEQPAQSGQPEDTAQSGQLEDTAQSAQPENTAQSGLSEQPVQSGQPKERGQLEQPSEAVPPQYPKPKRSRRPSKDKIVQNKNRGGPTLTPVPSLPGDYGNVRRAMGNQDGNKHPLNDDQGPPLGQELERKQSYGHVHVRRREVPESPVNLASTVPAKHPNDLEHQHEECLNLTQLLFYYGLNSDSLISPTTFTYLCPALLYQIDSRVCIRHDHKVDIAQATPEPAHPAWIWMWGFVSITIISLLSLLGVVLVPILNQSCFKFLLTFLVALAVGTLSGDALLHLLPHSQGEHDHGNPAPVKDLLTKFDGVWKGLTALAGIYLLFIIEHCIGMFKHYKDQGGRLCRKRRKGEEAKIGRKLSDHKLNRRSDAEWLHLKPLTADGADSSMLSCDNKHNDTQLTELQDPDSPSRRPLSPVDPEHDHQGAESPATEKGRKAKAKRHGHGHSHGHSHGHDHCHSDQEMKDAGIASIAWMVIMGDGMHNFSDGLAIGAAFSANVTGGISTSVAVFCHELPHELGDFAVLLKAGMSVKQAIVYNLLSALMAYVGMLIGTAVGQYTHNVTSWIFAITAGMFLYVALVDMLPEMLHGDSEDHKRCQFGHFLLQNMGLLTGFTLMLLIAIFEDRIVLDFGF